jgi:predicted NBD/HSP70 family sugar kinase
MNNNQAFNSGAEATLGIDIGGTHIRYVVSNNSEVYSVEKSKSPNTYNAMFDELLRIISEAQKVADIRNVGIGVPGRTDPDKPIWIPMLPFLNHSNLGGELEKAAEVDVTFINDAQAALVGEVEAGAARGYRNAILVTLGTGIGGGIMINGRIYVGHNGTAGSFGWLMAPIKLFPKPEHGPWERWSSGTTLAGIAKDLGVQVQEILDPTILEANSVLHDSVNDFSIRIGKGLGSLASLFDPQVLIISGGLTDSWTVLHEGIRAGYLQSASPSVRNTPVRVAELGSKAGAIGASNTARDYFSEIRKKGNVRKE